MSIRGTTVLYGIIGNPVAHSLSPLFQNAFLQQRRIDAVYLPFPVGERSRLPEALAGLHACGVAGLNVTVPYKEEAARLVDCDADAAAIGAVNTLRRTEQGWQGCNTDWIGIRRVIEALLDDPQDAELLLFGAGGTARAVLQAALRLGIPRIRLCNRTFARARALADGAAGRPTAIRPIAWRQEEVGQACRRAHLIINTTTLGLKGDAGFPFILPPCDTAPPGAAFDAVYSPTGETPFTKAAADGGRRTVDGLPLLIAQGVAAFYYWHDMQLNPQQALEETCRALGRTAPRMRGWEMDS
ncbi:MAG: shikimate dehydrogenase [Zetaproteobacteria bacterium]|nr:MAG: shikimate dehydrogenase [Zetaproteobacteria bacterium]